MAEGVSIKANIIWSEYVSQGLGAEKSSVTRLGLEISEDVPSLTPIQVATHLPLHLVDLSQSEESLDHNSP